VHFEIHEARSIGESRLHSRPVLGVNAFTTAMLKWGYSSKQLANPLLQAGHEKRDHWVIVMFLVSKTVPLRARQDLPIYPFS
jgi:hypothetical protein